MAKHPNLRLKLTGADGNAFSILARAETVMKKASVPREEIDKFLAEARAGDYDHLLRTCMEWFDVD